METRGRNKRRAGSDSEGVASSPSPSSSSSRRAASPGGSKLQRSYKEALVQGGKGTPAPASPSSRASTPSKNRASPSPAAVTKAVEVKGKEPETVLQILMFYPNLIGYVRVGFMLASLYYAKSDWVRTLVFYLLAFVGDVVDGYVARYFDMCTQLGGVLDMVTDRISTAGFLVMLSSLYPEFTLAAALLICLDIASHWFHVMSVSGHHKSQEALQNRNALLQWYYSIYPLFGYCCVGAEMFYVLLYVLRFYPDPIVHKICFYGCFPACALKQLVNFVQLWSAMENIALVDVHNRANK